MLGRRTLSLELVILICVVCACGDDDKKSSSGSPVETEDAGGGEAVDAASPAESTGTIPKDIALPIVFVHGFAGSASQYQSQAMRFIANGYPEDRIRAFDHDGAGFDVDAFVAGVDEFIDAARKDLKSDKVYLVGHSRGTLVSSNYLGDAAHAAKVAKYISLDGAGCAAADMAGVPCIAPNQAGLPGEKHVEVATSDESFKLQYKFLVGDEAKIVKIERQDTPVKISGRAVNFPANTGRDGATLDVWEIETATGVRAGDKPIKTFKIAADGNWGPVVVNPDKHYELLLTGAEGAQQHFYPQPFLRSSVFVRLLSGPPDSPARVNSNTGDHHAAVTALRMREWTKADVIEVSTKSKSGDQPVVNAVTSETGEGSIGFYIQDDAATPAETTLKLLPWFPMQAFQTGVDVFIPAADPPDGTITIRSLPRGDESKPQVLNIPNWSSKKHTIMAVFNDFVD
jgi:hypothetical protein